MEHDNDCDNLSFSPAYTLAEIIVTAECSLLDVSHVYTNVCILCACLRNQIEACHVFTRAATSRWSDMILSMTHGNMSIHVLSTLLLLRKLSLMHGTASATSMETKDYSNYRYCYNHCHPCCCIYMLHLRTWKRTAWRCL